MRSTFVLVLVVTGCATPVTNHRRVVTADQELAQFMRETVNVPFTFAVIDSMTPRRRVLRAAAILREAASNLRDWQTPPVRSVTGREVFFAYATTLEFQAAKLASSFEADRDTIADRLDDIRKTCNSCHRLFVPAHRNLRDVGYSPVAMEE